MWLRIKKRYIDRETFGGRFCRYWKYSEFIYKQNNIVHKHGYIGKYYICC